jgi:general secretion pathway protein A
MYLDHWRLQARPFETAPDVRFYYGAAAHEGALAKLLYAAENHLAAGLVWGPPGSGKTLVLEVLRRRLDPERFFPVWVSVAAEAPEELLYALLAGLGETELSPLKSQVLAAALHRRIDEWLAAVRESGRHTVLLVDEAHLLRERRALESVRLLLNPQPGSSRALTLVLAGQEDLASRVARFTPLDERIDVRAPLGRMTEEEALGYLLRRIEAAGGARGIFTRKAAVELARAAGSLPGPMNRLAELCLVTGFAARLDRVGPDVVAEAVRDLETGRAGAAEAASAANGRGGAR